eukprot:gene10087-2254_t
MKDIDNNSAQLTTNDGLVTNKLTNTRSATISNYTFRQLKTSKLQGTASSLAQQPPHPLTRVTRIP